MKKGLKCKGFDKCGEWESFNCYHARLHDESSDCTVSSQAAPCRNFKCVSINEIRKEKLNKIQEL